MLNRFFGRIKRTLAGETTALPSVPVAAATAAAAAAATAGSCWSLSGRKLSSSVSLSLSTSEGISAAVTSVSLGEKKKEIEFDANFIAPSTPNLRRRGDLNGWHGCSQVFVGFGDGQVGLGLAVGVEMPTEVIRVALLARQPVGFDVDLTKVV